MSSEVFAFIEIKSESGWVLFKGFTKRHHHPPHNLAPISWGGFNFTVYYEVSGERDLPEDLSDGIKKIIAEQTIEWGKSVINRPSWMWVEEILAFKQSDPAGRFAHFDTELLKEVSENQPSRVIFWSV